MKLSCQQRMIIGAIGQFLLIITTVDAISPGSYERLSKEKLLELDREVSQFYYTSLEQWDQRNITYDDYLFKTIRALRHTTVLNQFDYKYSKLDTVMNSRGKQVDERICERQLKTLVDIAGGYKQSSSAPLSVVNFLESSGRAESGILNGNFIWLGSYSSCTRAKIPAKTARLYLQHLNGSDHSTAPKEQEEEEEEVINGRYCVVHLKAKSWPKWDIYFEDRISIKVALCIPETCHTSSYLNSKDIQRNVDFLVRSNLVAPYNDEQHYEATYLYCLPDEDSPFRQLDLGAKLFIGFCCFWLALTIYTNLKYHQRLKTMQKLREAVDIRMIINQRRESCEHEVGSSGDEENLRSPQQLNKSSLGDPLISSCTSNGKGGEQESQINENNQQSLKLPHCESRASSPMPSDVEENDGEFNVIRRIVVSSSTSTTKTKNQKRKSSGSANDSIGSGVKYHGLPSSQESDGIDLPKAFSIKCNLEFLFGKRSNKSKTKQIDIQNKGWTTQEQKRLSQQFNSIGGRTSSSNEALIKDLQQHEEEQGETKSNVAIISSVNYAFVNRRDPMEASKKIERVNIDILDGIKVFATCYIIFGHTMMFFFGLVTDLRFGNERMFDLTMIVALNTLQVVGLFYIITGVLLTYLAFNRRKAKQLMQPSFWILVIIGRYIRLIPTYMLVFWFAKHVAPYMGSGADWYDYRTDLEHIRGYCSGESWKVMLTMSAADIKIPFDCVPQSWYLSNDFRTLLILPFYIIILAKNQVAGYVAILSTFVFSSIKLVRILQVANIDYKVILHWQPHVYSLMADRLHDVYTDLAGRLSTYLLGVVVGHLLYLYEDRQIKRWPKWFTSYGLKIAFITGTSFFMGAILLASPLVNQFLPARDDVNSDSVVILIPLFKTAMEMCFCVTLILLVTGGGYNWLTQLLSSKTAKVLSNISYGVFLVHVEFMYKVPSIKFEASWWYLFVYSTFFIVASNLIALIIHVLYEMPINNTTRYIFKRILKMIDK